MKIGDIKLKYYSIKDLKGCLESFMIDHPKEELISSKKLDNYLRWVEREKESSNEMNKFGNKLCYYCNCVVFKQNDKKRKGYYCFNHGIPIKLDEKRLKSSNER